jgi:hypothetical protein
MSTYESNCRILQLVRASPFQKLNATTQRNFGCITRDHNLSVKNRKSDKRRIQSPQSHLKEVQSEG